MTASDDMILKSLYTAVLHSLVFGARNKHILDFLAARFLMMARTDMI